MGPSSKVERAAGPHKLAEDKHLLGPLPDILREAFIDPRSSTQQQHRTLGYQIVDLLIDHLSTLATRPVFGGGTPDLFDQLFSAPLPGTGTDAETLVTQDLAPVLTQSMAIGHPRHLGHMDGPPQVLAIYGDLIISALNQNLLSWELAPAATHIEQQVIRWLAEMLGLAGDAGGALVSGGTEANLTALWVARNLALAQDHSAEASLVFFASQESHLSFAKAADLLHIHLVSVPTADDGTILLTRLEQAIEQANQEGRRPFALVATAGTTNCGAIDPLESLAACAQAHGLWFHVDAAYGGAACCSRTYRARLVGIAAADSVTIDPHKWLGLPKSAGVILFRDAHVHQRAIQHTAPYLERPPRDGGARVNLGEAGVQGSRRFDALKVWLALKHLGSSGVEALIDRTMAAAAYLTERIRASDDLELLHEPVLNIVCFRYWPAATGGMLTAEEEYARTEEIQAILEREGRGWLSLTTLAGQRALRAVLLNPWTDTTDIDAVLAEVSAIGRRLSEHAARKE